MTAHLEESMPEPSCPLVIADSLPDADRLIRAERLTGPRGRVLLGRDTPAHLVGTSAPAVHITPAAWLAEPGQVTELVNALRFENPAMEVHWPPSALAHAVSPFDGPSREEQDAVRLQLDQDTDQVLADGVLRRIQATVEDRVAALAVWMERVPVGHQPRASREVVRRQSRTGMTLADAIRSVADDYAAGRLG